METQFYIVLSLKTPGRFESYGQYFLGNNREVAYQLFSQLKGSKQLSEHYPLHFDLMETVDELPVRIKSICCTLEELACNSKLIAKEIFRQKNLKVYEE